ncbi:site-specific integrase [Patescibacteria group bacterium]|nr:site-specific integrase [Patescibacteria group bacterium]
MQQLLNQYKDFLEGRSKKRSVLEGTPLRPDLKGLESVLGPENTSSEPSISNSKPSQSPMVPNLKSSLVPNSKAAGFGTFSGPQCSEGQFRTLSVSTIKNYISDTKHFLTYLKTTYQEPTIKPAHITSTTIKDYLDLLSKTSPHATLKRRFSSLKRFTDFLYITKLLDSDPLKDQRLDNSQKNTSTGKILDTFKNFLKSEGLANSTIKNYASDINHYLQWANKNLNLTDKYSQAR